MAKLCEGRVALVTGGSRGMGRAAAEALERVASAGRLPDLVLADLEKRALALLAGWRLLELGREEIRSEKGIAWRRLRVHGKRGQGNDDKT